MYTKKSILILCLLVFIILTSCSKNKPINYTKQEGKFSKSNTETISNKYEMKYTNGFSAAIDFDLKEGKVDWEILNPKAEVVFSGYVVNDNGETYRQLIYPVYPENHTRNLLNQKAVEQDETDLHGNILHVPDFGGLQFEIGSLSGTYTLNFKPDNAEGSYYVQWSDRLGTK